MSKESKHFIEDDEGKIYLLQSDDIKNFISSSKEDFQNTYQIKLKITERSGIFTFSVETRVEWFYYKTEEKRNKEYEALKRFIKRNIERNDDEKYLSNS